MLEELKNITKGELKVDNASKILYATDASAYREIPIGVFFPTDESDVQAAIAFCNEKNIPIIPRAAGTSLAGQVVGNGLVMDISRTFNAILNINADEKTVTVQPGVIRDELNRKLKEYELFFGPETSTSNRCMIGGMLGNNSCGSRSLIYGSVRDHVKSVKGFLADGTAAEFGEIDLEEYHFILEKENEHPLHHIYSTIHHILNNPNNREHITNVYPKPEIPRRNTGYAIDILAQSEAFGGKEKINLAQLIAGSEGTLFFATEITLGLVDAPQPYSGVLCSHFNTVHESLVGNIEALKYNPTACELIDHFILDCTKGHLEFKKFSDFIIGNPGALLIIELTADTEEGLHAKKEKLKFGLESKGLGYAHPFLQNEDIDKVWNLRKAGLGLLSNIPGDAKPVAVVEDTAVDVNDLPNFIHEFSILLKQRNLSCVHYAHAATGELHLRPILNLKTAKGQKLFKDVATDIAHLVKKYRGSLSGEHGDGRLRGEFIPFMYGPKVMGWYNQIKDAFDPNHILNPGKILNTPSMNTSLRYEKGQKTPKVKTQFRFDEQDGFLRSIEACNGSGDCRKTEISGGTMCPSYMVTKDELDSTRGRANILRELLTQSSNPQTVFGHPDAEKALELCISCKGCKNECPSNVDMAKIKSEYAYQKQLKNGVPKNVQLMAKQGDFHEKFRNKTWLYNLAVRSPLAYIIKSQLKIHQKRKLPKMSEQPFSQWYNADDWQVARPKAKVVLIIDEFTEFLDANVAKAGVKVLQKLKFKIEEVIVLETGRLHFSKGLLNEAKVLCDKNLNTLKGKISDDIHFVGFEPSAILSFRDEYPKICAPKNIETAEKLASKVQLIDEFLADQLEEGSWSEKSFKKTKKEVLIHGHCHQKALGGITPTKKILNVPKNFKSTLIPSGCCGMAGSFGYEKEHYSTSMKIGELVLFPFIKKAKNKTVVASGFSCRHQIQDGTKIKALHPIELLAENLLK